VLSSLTLGTSEEQSSVRTKLIEVQHRGIRLSAESANEIRGVHQAVLQVEKALASQISDAVRKIDSERADSLAEIRAGLSALMTSVNSIPKSKTTEETILRRLYFPSMGSRIEAIADAEFDTFRWLFSSDGSDSGPEYWREREEELRSRTRDSFMAWLRTENGVYHVCGKAGSGKSTLMKLLCRRARFPEGGLGEWASGKKMVLASFFFWNAGDRCQRTLEGFYRSLLFDVLRQCPELIKDAFPSYWGATVSESTPNDEKISFLPSELRAAMHTILAKLDLPDYRFCFFIDGLDEFEPDLNTDFRDLAQDLVGWAKSSDVKMCVSSRPYEEFLQLFDPRRRIQLHELTRGDIQRFVYGALAKEPNYQKLNMGGNGGAEEIARIINDRADGVFLWVRIVVRSLADGIRHQTPFYALEQKLYKTPPGVEQLLDQLFKSVDPSDRERSDKMLLLAASEGPLNALMYSWIDFLADPRFPYGTEVFAYPEEEIRFRHENVRAQLLSLSKGLLEMGRYELPPMQPLFVPKQSPSLYFQQRVDFFHRSVKEYLNEPKVLAGIKDRLGGKFNVVDAIQRLRLAEFKYAPTMACYFEPQQLRLAPTELSAAFRDIFHHEQAAYPSKLLDECERVLEHHRKTPFTHSDETEKNTGVVAWGCALSSHSPHDETGGDFSYMHYLVSLPSCHGHVKQRLLSGAGSTLPPDAEGMLFAASYLFLTADHRSPLRAHESLAHKFLKAGVSPNAEIRVPYRKFALTPFGPRLQKLGYVEGDTKPTTPWAVFLWFVAQKYIHDDWRVDRSWEAIVTKELFLLVEEYLNHGAECDVSFDLELVRSEDEDWSDKNVSLSFEDFILHIRPPNQDVIVNHLLGLKGFWLWQGTKQILTTALSPWTGGLQRTPMMYPRARLGDLKDTAKGYQITGIQCGGRRLEVGFHMRLY